MKSISAACWKCGAVQLEILLPLSRTEQCKDCGADLHVCRQCRFYDRSAGDECREPIAEKVSDKTRANFCGYLEIRTDAGPDSSASGATNEDLDALFGLDSNAPKSDAVTSLDDLFKTPGKSE